ncbi:hypothetical protein VTJ83DRAFT_1874 [Remersonia thermophila]|uniref:Protein kinase domain-containing protein n=1 Tax=Remersonia thermophila TaxID=72144 RepID=A0ABR4DH46_9PEZI
MSPNINAVSSDNKSMSRFTFLSDNLVETGKDGVAFLVRGGKYIVHKVITGGVQNRVQIVADVHTKELFVRKTSKKQFRYTGSHGPSSTDIPVDDEIRILESLNSFPLRDPKYPDERLRPRWITCVRYYEAPDAARGNRATRVSYWKLCNGGTLHDLIEKNDRVPVSVLARCIAQVCETLHVMYHCGKEPVYHCDLHLANVFVHWPGGAAYKNKPDFYIGDFGYSRTASQSWIDTACCYGAAAAFERRQWELAHDRKYSEPPRVAQPGCRRRWDIAHFLGILAYKLDRKRMGRHPGFNLLKELLDELQKLDDKDHKLATRDPTSKPPPLLPMAKTAREVEAVALRAERDMESYDAFLENGREAVRSLTYRPPFVWDRKMSRRPALTPFEVIKQDAMEWGFHELGGDWTVIRSV